MKSSTRLSDFTFTFHFHALEKEMAAHASVLAWRIPGMGGAWWAAVYGVIQSWTRLKQLSSSSSNSRWHSGKESACQCRRCRFHPCQEEPLEEEMEVHSSILAWKIPWTEESCGLQSVASLKSPTGLNEHTCTLLYYIFFF